MVLEIMRVSAMIVGEEDRCGITIIRIGLNGVPELPHLFVRVLDGGMVIVDVCGNMGNMVCVPEIDKDNIRLVFFHDLDDFVEDCRISFSRIFRERVIAPAAVYVLTGIPASVGRMGAVRFKGVGALPEDGPAFCWRHALLVTVVLKKGGTGEPGTSIRYRLPGARYECAVPLPGNRNTPVVEVCE